jgi:ribokinase
MARTPARRIAVVGHVQHVTLGRVDALPAPGEIVRLTAPTWFPGGGGGMAFFQLLRSPAEVLLFTALGDDSTGAAIAERIRATGAGVHAVTRPVPHPRDLVLVTPDRERTIVVVDDPLHPRRDDPLPWDLLATCDAVFFTAYDPAIIVAARAARILIVTARRSAVLREAGVRADAVVGSALDPREVTTRDAFPTPPDVLVMTEGARGGSVHTQSGTTRFGAPPTPAGDGTAYGAGDSFAAALTWYIACGLPPAEACMRAAEHGAAVLGGPSPLESQRPLA